MFDYMYLRLVYLYDDRKVYLTNEPLWVRFCVWFLLTFFQERLCIDKLLKQIASQKQDIRTLERKVQLLQVVYLKATGELAESEMLDKGAKEGDLAWLEQEYPKRKRGNV